VDDREIRVRFAIGGNKFLSSPLGLDRLWGSHTSRRGIQLSTRTALPLTVAKIIRSRKPRIQP
jgi:hypothetical protein